MLCCSLPFYTMNLYCFMSVLSAFFFPQNTRLGVIIVCILWFVFRCFVLNYCLSFVFHSYKKGAKNKQGKSKKKTEKHPKMCFFSLAQLCSQNSVPNFWGWALKKHFCWKRYKIVVAAYCATAKNGQKLLNFKKSKLGPSTSQKLVQFCYATELDQFLTWKHSQFWLCFLSHFPCRMKSSFQKKRKQ